MPGDTALEQGAGKGKWGFVVIVSRKEPAKGPTQEDPHDRNHSSFILNPCIR